MGHSSKKKKRGGGGRKGKGRATSKDHPSHADDDPNLLSEEITALSAIFQDDFKLVSESPHTQFIINLRPYSNDMGSEDVNVSALLLVRCLPGYPYRCPKLQIVPEKGLSKDNADRLLSLLTDQANFNAQEGRVMIFNLVEVAQEFLSEITPVVQPVECVPSLGVDKKDQWLHGDVAIVCDQTCSSSGQFVYGLIDLFSDLCGDVGSWDWSIGTNTINASFSHISQEQAISTYKSGDKKSSTHTNMGASNTGYGAPLNHHSQNLKPVPLFDTKEGSVPPPIAKLDVVEEETEDDSKSISPTTSHVSSREETLETDSNGDMPEDSPQKNVALREKMTEADDSDLEGRSLDSFSFFSTSDHQTSEGMEQDLVMVHLLRLACSSKGPLAHALPDITSELYKLGILSKRVRDLAMEPPLLFNKAFEDAFGHYTVSSPISQFWKASADFVGENTLSLPSSRYLNDFEEISSLGHGGFGHVMLCKNKLDGRQYAVKKIQLKDRSLPVNDKILREVATLSRLQHQHVVRYYQAWFETEVGGYGDTTWDSLTAGSSSCGYKGDTSTNPIGPDNKLESTFLYIQMEYCPRTLRQVFESYTGFDKEFTWHLFRQIVEGLAHIHGQGIIHRDLTPNNIFFDARNDIKIGDFGLAKFLKLEQVDHDPSFQNETAGASMDGTGQVGTYFYTAPEIEQGWPQVNEKVDMYSLGVVFFELWYPFSTAMERNIVLSDLTQKGVLPATWVAKFPGQSSLLQRLMSPSPSDRPSAKELLQHELPPRMEDEWLNDILRTIQTSEDTYVYERVVSAVFDEERVIMKANRQHGGREKMTRDESSFIQYTELDTELRDHACEVAQEVFRQHGAKRLEITPMRILDDCQHFNRKAVKLLTPGGNMLELCHELRLPFVNWVITNQGDFDIIGGVPALTEAETIKVATDIVTRYFHSNAYEIRLNHAQILDAIWSWIGIEGDLRQNVAKLLSSMGSLRPQSSSRKTRWTLVRRQLLQDLNLSEAVVNRLKIVDLRFCGSADQALARLRGALPSDKSTRKALEDLSALFSYLRVWRIEKHVTIDALMPPTESYYRELIFQIYLIKDSNASSFSEGTLFAVGGRYDYLVQHMWYQEYKSSPPGAVGISLALEKILHHSSVEFRPSRNEPSTNVLICARGGGGLLKERMELVAELWQAHIQASIITHAATLALTFHLCSFLVRSRE
ncbi:eIF-2-alpha kinase GCN2 isoform X2 [Magnolia sinica]|uniref:eIF-2-alpha kinase GCN2 isoform X2 n=1 Tax=Magnolia sinica TaxID=86752 RepID=UPI002658EF47|nr:eIF-2-alpha kinase GCN2 isoform X2 [Magnolia sinica]